jgi:hypothetical protein
MHLHGRAAHAGLFHGQGCPCHLIKDNESRHLGKATAFIDEELVLREHVDGRFQQRLAVVIVKDATRNIFELLVGDFSGLFGLDDFFAHISSSGLVVGGWLIGSNFLIRTGR